jgi:hypothetical protein
MGWERWLQSVVRLTYSTASSSRPPLLSRLARDLGGHLRLQNDRFHDRHLDCNGERASAWAAVLKEVGIGQRVQSGLAVRVTRQFFRK